MKVKYIFQVIGILLGTTIIYWPTLGWLYDRYIAADSYYSHGFLVPFVSAFLIWMNRKHLSGESVSSSWAGLLLVIFALTAHYLSMVFEVFFVSAFSILPLFIGVCLFFYGNRITRILLFPLCFLFFMFPLPLVAINAISFPMKMLATKSAVFMLKHFMRIPIQNEGFQILFPNASLIVGNPCSGLRSLISMLALGSIFAYLLKAKPHRRIFLFSLSAPIAFASNLIRVILLSLGAYIYGTEATVGFFHDFTGYLAFFLAFITLWIIWKKFQSGQTG